LAFGNDPISPVELTDKKGYADDASEASKPSYEDIGLTGLNRFANYIYEEFLPQLRYPFQAAKIYQEMSENDPTIGSILYMTEQLVRKCEWWVKPASGSDEDKAAAQFVFECMNDMSTSWKDTINEILSMFVYGFSFHEVIYKIRRGPTEKNGKYRSLYTDGKIGWREIPIRSQSTLYGWRFAEDSKAVSFIQWAPPHYILTEIPFSKGLLFTTKSIRSNPQGRSLLRNAYRPWYFKKRIEEIEGIGIERDLAGLPVLQPPETVNIWDKNNPQSVALLQQAEQLVRTIKRDAAEGIVIPFGWDLKLLSTGGTRQFDTNQIVNRYDQRIAITMLADLVMLGSDKVGSFALGEVKKSLMANAIEAFIQNIASVFNKFAVIPLLEMNGFKCPNGYPEITPDEIEAPSLEDVARIFKATGLRIDADLDVYNYVRKILQIEPINEEDFEKLKDEQLKFAQAAGTQPFTNKEEPPGVQANKSPKGQQRTDRAESGDSDG